MSRDRYEGGPGKTAFVWHTRDLILSPAWRGRSRYLAVLIDYLEEQLMRDGRERNGQLTAEYRKLVERGISSYRVAPAIEEGERRGLIQIVRSEVWPRDGKRPPNRFLLTFAPTLNEAGHWQKPADTWRHFVETDKPKRPTLRRSRHSGKPSETAKNLLPPTVAGEAAAKIISTPPIPVAGPLPPTVAGEEPKPSNPAKNLLPPAVAKPATADGCTSKILRVRGARSAPAGEAQAPTVTTTTAQYELGLDAACPTEPVMVEASVTEPKIRAARFPKNCAAVTLTCAWPLGNGCTRPALPGRRFCEEHERC